MNNNGSAATALTRRWRLLTITAAQTLPDGPVDTCQTLQPRSWLRRHRADVGGVLALDSLLDLAEMGVPQGVVGTIVSVAAAPRVERGPGRVVLTTVRHLNNFVFNLTLQNAAGQTDTLGVTGYHKFYDQAEGWQSVVDLTIRDTLRGRDGQTVTVTAVTRDAGTHRVYNLTVEADHVYFVGDLTTLTHNNCPHPIRAYQLDSYDGFSTPGRSIVGDAIEGHELLQHAWLKDRGLATYSLSTDASKLNPVIALPRGLHTRIDTAQRVFDVSKQTARENILANRQLLLDFGLDRKQVKKLTSRAVRHAQELGIW